MDQQTFLALMRQDLEGRRLRDRMRVEELAQQRTNVGTSKGRGLSTSPTARGAGPAVPAVTLQRGGPAGEIIHTSGTSDSVVSGGDYLVADTDHGRVGFSGTTLGDTYTIPRTANYYLKLNQTWDSYLLGGTWELELNGTVVPNSTVDAGGLGDGIVTSWGFHASKGDTVKVKVTQDSESAQAATFTLTLMVAEPVRAIADPGWTKVASVDAWGIFNDGTSWWVTEGASGLTVTEYNSSWVQQSTFETDFGGGFVRGITSDGTDLWITGDVGGIGVDDKVKQYQTDGTKVSEFATSGDDSVQGVAFDGTDLWVSEGQNTRLRRYNTSGTLQETISLPAARLGLAIYDGKFVLVDTTNDVVEVRDSAGVLVQSIPTSGAIDGPTGVWVDGTGTVYVSKDGDGVYRWDGSL